MTSQAPSSAPHLEGGLGILDIDTYSTKLFKHKMDSKVIESYQCSLERSHTVSIELNSNQGLVLFRQKQMRRSTRHINSQKQNNDDFFIQLLNAWFHFTNNEFPTSTYTEEIFDHLVF